MQRLLNGNQLIKHSWQQLQIQRIRSIRLGACRIIVHFHKHTIDASSNRSTRE